MVIENPEWLFIRVWAKFSQRLIDTKALLVKGPRNVYHHFGVPYKGVSEGLSPLRLKHQHTIRTTNLVICRVPGPLQTIIS